MTNKLINIEGQDFWHQPAHIYGTIDGLLALQTLINQAITVHYNKTLEDNECMASDGEGFELKVKCVSEKEFWKLNHRYSEDYK
jgi:hypothetical protein